MFVLSLFIPLVLILSFLFNKKKISIFIIMALLITSVFLFIGPGNEISRTYQITLYLILLSIPFLVHYFERMSGILSLAMNRKLADFDNSLKNIEQSQTELQNKIGALEKQSVAVSELYEITKDMSVSLHFEEILTIFQNILCKGFTYSQGFLVTIKYNPAELEIDKIYQICQSPEKRLKEAPLPNASYYKALDYVYRLRESRYIEREDEIGVRLGLPMSKSIAIALLKVENRIMGAVILEGLPQEDFNRLYISSAQFSLELKKVTLYEQIEELATTDSLTGLYVRRKFSELTAEELSRAAKHKMSLAIFMLDVDFFKECNDRYGHLTGDHVLKNVARILKTTLREIDLVGRYGGEEFSILLPDTELDEAKIVSERLIQSVRNYDFKAYDQKFKITISIGVAVFPQDGDTLIRLTELADKALYAAKELGRDRSVFYREIAS